MTEPSLPEESIFLQAVEIPSAEERAGYLDRACGEDRQLRAAVEALLRAHDKSGDLLDLPERPPPTAEEAAAERPGTVIGPYKLLEQIGEGGMGTVWMAQQTEPVKRVVALKLIKAGMDSKQVIARFEAERQALALVDHPNIARVLDGGTTSAGRLYFVMDLVKGVPITRYCDEHHLTPRQRLELFLPVCQAVQHAHMKGIIHRDLKPSNVLVALNDGKPVPKVIDFGVAKAAGQPLTDKTLVTGFGVLVGTLEYMSPEQAEINQLDVDTRSDIYALGVLLYELLTGSPPFSRQELEKAGMLEMLRVIREQEPSKPSTKLSTAEGLPTLAANRGTEPGKLTKLVRGELDWIVMKALEKDRNRRYQTANGFAMDVQRYLADEPVQACPPSAGYRLRKFARRNKKVLATVAAFLLLLVAATGTSIGLAAWALSERNHANGQTQLAQANEQEAKQRAEELGIVLDFVENQVFAAARPQGQEGGLGRDTTLRQAVETALVYVEVNFRDQPLIQARLHATLGASFHYLGDYKTAEAVLVRARAVRAAHLGADHPDTLDVMTRLGSVYYVQGRYRDAFALQKETLELQKASLGPDHRETLRSMNNVATCLSALGHRDDAIILHEEVLARQKAKFGEDHHDTIRSMLNLAMPYLAAGRHAEALEFGEKAHRYRLARFGPNHPDTLRSMRLLGRIYARIDRHTHALDLCELAFQLHRDVLGPEHPETLLCMADVATSYYALRRFDDAAKLREETLPKMKAKFGVSGFQTLRLMNDLAAAYEAIGRHEDAATMREEMRKHMKSKHNTGPPKTGDGK